MSQKVVHDARGITHPIMIIVVLIVIAAVGFAGWRVMQKNKDKTPANSATTAIADAIKQAAANCDLDDKDLCKFWASWKAHSSYKMTSTDTTDGKTSTSTFESQGDDKFHMTTTGDVSYETISLGTTLYTKDPSDGKWWKQTIPQDKVSDYKGSADQDFEEPSKDEPAAEKTIYKKLGTEACGNLTCFKYEIVDPSAKDTKQFIWFDTKDYQLRKSRSETGNNISEQTYTYDNVSITAPSPIKELGANQVIVPGQSEPMTLPDTSNLQQYLNSLPADTGDQSE